MVNKQIGLSQFCRIIFSRRALLISIEVQHCFVVVFMHPISNKIGGPYYFAFVRPFVMLFGTGPILETLHARLYMSSP